MKNGMKNGRRNGKEKCICEIGQLLRCISNGSALSPMKIRGGTFEDVSASLGCKLHMFECDALIILVPTLGSSL